MLLRSALKYSSCVLREWSALSVMKQNASALESLHGGAYAVMTVRPLTNCFLQRRNSDFNELKAGEGGVLVQAVRHYARAMRKKKEIQSQLDDLPPTMLRMEYAAVPLATATDDVVRRLLSLELASHRDKLRLKEEQLVAKVRRTDTDRSSTEVKVALMTARIRNYQEHLLKHPKDKANKRRMLMLMDRRKKQLKYLRRTRHDAFQLVCQRLGISYTFPPEYYRRVTKRWLAKKAFCIKVFKAVQKQRTEERRKAKQAALLEKVEDAGKAPGEAGVTAP